MKTIEKINIRLHNAANYTDAHELVGVINILVINILIDKVNELTEKLNELNFEVAGIHEWKIEKEGI